MTIQNLSMPSFATTLLGVVRGVLDYYGVSTTDATAFGGSGHAFLINIHEQLCPSGPYCWRYEEFYRLLGNLGLRAVELGFFDGDSGPAERAAVEEELRRRIQAGIPCSLMNMDHQLVVGYDESAFLLAQPWGDDCGVTTPARLSFGSWSELGEEIHASFLAFERQAEGDRAAIVADSLRYAVDLYRRPDRYALPGYGVGPRAYDNWLAAVGEFGNSHGNWWNAQVWSECRAMASQYLAEIEASCPALAREAHHLAGEYKAIASGLARVGERQLDADQKRALLSELKAREEQAVASIEALLPELEKV